MIAVASLKGTARSALVNYTGEPYKVKTTHFTFGDIIYPKRWTHLTAYKKADYDKTVWPNEVHRIVL